MRRFLLLFFLLAVAAPAARAETELLPGSIDFNTPGLWGREVKFGLDDSGNYTGLTRWYRDSDGNGATIRRHPGRSTGYLQNSFGCRVHRTLLSLKKHESGGPAATTGQNIPKDGVYIDSRVAMSAYFNRTEPLVFSDRDKLNCWISVSDAGYVLATNFVITAGGENGPTNYVTDAVVAPSEEFGLVVKASANEGNVGFEVFVNGVQVSCGDVTVFPSLQAADSAYASKLYSFGVSGIATVDKVNFTTVDPQEDPTYDRDDVSMMRECADIAIPGYEGEGALVDFPLLVRVSETRLRGFYYSRTLAGGRDICFTDENGRIIPHEVDTWDPNGESLVWVKVPYLTKGTKITMHWSVKPGYAVPANDPMSVWSDYIAVWHFSDAANGQAQDSAGHDYTATMRDGGTLGEADTAVFGTAGAAKNGSLMSSDYERSFPTEGRFTVSGWFRTPGVSTYGSSSSAIFGKKAGGARAADSLGWCGLAWSKTELRFYTDGSDYQGKTGLADLAKNWLYAGFTLSDGSRAEGYANGVLFKGWSASVTAVTNDFLLAANGVQVDELRVTRKVRSQDWMKAEYDQAVLDGYTEYAPAVVKGDDNYWIEEPFVQPSSLDIDEISKLVVYAGRPRFGDVILTFVDDAGNVSRSKPATAGSYRAVAWVKGGVRQELRKEIPFVIYEKRAYRQLAGSDRTMLFNADSSPDCPVFLQGYYDVDSGRTNVWDHEGDDWEGLLPYVEDGTLHVYYEPETHRRLWEFRHARIGNLFSGVTGLVGGMNYLPWGGYANRLEESQKRADRQCYAGALILQNRSTLSDPEDPAGAYSPLFPDGVGTVYFDAVNAYCGYVNGLKLQMCADAASADVTRGKWTDVAVDVFAIRDGVYDASMSSNGVTEIALAMDKAQGTTNWFYRIRAHIDTTDAVRLRIVRTDADWAEEGGEDGEGLVLVDNIVVSYPAMGVRVSQYGAPADPDDLVLRGQRAPFDVAFPTVADLGRMRGLVKVDYIANNTNTVDTSFVGALTFSYRWRYLNQFANDWKDVLMAPDPADVTKFVTTEPLAGEGLGDIEYRCEAVVNAPFYSYWDYSGLANWIWPDGYTERRGNVGISAERDGVYGPGNKSPALGVDYFVRLREGASEYEGVRLHVKRSDVGPFDTRAAEEVVEMTPTDSNTWRGFYQTLTNGVTNVYYRIEMYNRQAETGCAYQWNTNWYQGVSQKDIPCNDVLTEGDAWARLPCDELTGYLMFQLEDNTRSLSVIHADYQDFNAWTDARLDSGCFVGTSTALPTSGVSRTARSYSDDFSEFHASVSSNSLWIERFVLTGSEVVSTEGPWAVDIPFKGEKKNTPNGWSAESGMWVCEAFRELGGKSFALQLLAESSGRLTMNRQKAPHGIEKITYSARIAQTYLSHPFDYYVGTTNDVYNMQNYTFAVPCAMTTSEEEDFSGVGTVSAVARYRDSKGGYEARLERVAAKQVKLSLYKWHEDGSATLLGTSPQAITYGEGIGMDARNRKFGALFISCTNTPSCVRVMAGLMSESKELLDTSIRLSGSKFHKVCYEDYSDDRFTGGTFGVGSKDCPATFALPKLSNQSVDWNTTIRDMQRTPNSTFYYSTSPAVVSFANEHSLINYGEDYDEWNIYTERLPRKNFLEDMPYGVYGFKARLPEQRVIVDVATAGKEDWRAIATNVIDSFCFKTYEQGLYVCDDLDVRFRIGGEYGLPDVVLDDLEVRQWRGESYDDPDVTVDIPSSEVSYGAPTNFVFTTAWIHDGVSVEISPMRTRPTEPAGIRSPLFDGASGRGLGLGAFSFAYSNANPHARLVVQIATNGVNITTLSQRSESLEGWADVAVCDFADMTDDERAGGLISTYVGLHGVQGLMRVIVDPKLAAEARDPSVNPENDPEFGRVFLTAAGAKDNPVLDNGSWWGWNLRTTDEELRQLLKDGDEDVRLNGMSYALNNSIVNNTRVGDVYDRHKPFLQTPLLTRGAIGEITFKARKYDASDPSPSVAIYAMTAYDPAAKDEKFVFLTNIVISSERYETYTYQAPMSDNYTAFRLAVTGVEGIIGDGSAYPPEDPPEGPMPASGRVRRVMLDEVAVFEAIRARLGFCNVGVFRTHLSDNDPVPNVPSRAEQPLCKESWGVQTEIYAVRLSEKIDQTRAPRVFLHWYEGLSPWGYAKWADRADAHTAELSLAEGTKNVYRSSYIASPEAVVDTTQLPANSIVQYSLDVVYYMEGQNVPMTNTLSAGDWPVPEWYNPVDFNESLGRGENFSAFNILDEVAPGWAWINEINIFGDMVNYRNTDAANQYIEIAAPADASLNGWYVRLLVPESSSETVVIDKLATFTSDKGRQNAKGYLPATKTIGSASNMVFHVVANQQTKDAGKWKREDGTLDGVWVCETPSAAIDADGTLQYYQGMGVQLVRASGVVEHEVVAIGTNVFASAGNFGQYNPTNVVNGLNAMVPRSHFFYAGDDDGGLGKSLGVFDSHGEVSNFWNKTMIETPGRINQFQNIDPDHPVPFGSSITVFANIEGLHLCQTVGDVVRTNQNQVLIVRKGSETGTNVTYDVDNWYELASVGVSDGPEVWTYQPSTRHLTVAIARNYSNNTLTVTAKAQVDKRIRDLGCDEKNPYTPAVIDWLEHRHSLMGNGEDEPWEWPDSDGNVYLADFMGVNRQVITNMTLTQMYWLDICPTISNQCLIAGMVKPPNPDILKPVPGYQGEAWLTNLTMSVFMMITNRTEDQSSPYYGKAWSPYVLRGLDPGTNSWDYAAAGASWGWTNESFKITGILANGLTSEMKPENWVPLKYFVFVKDSFDKNFQTTVQIEDPHSPRSLGYVPWFLENPNDPSPIFYSWAIDTRLVPVNVGILQPTNLLDKTTNLLHINGNKW